MDDEKLHASCVKADHPQPLEEARRELAFQSRLLACVQEAVAAVDENYIISYWNQKAEQLTGCPHNNAIGRPVGDILRLKSIWGKPDIQDLVSCGDCNGEFLCILADGTSFPIRLHTQALRGDQDEWNGMIASFRDITVETRRDTHAEFFGDIGYHFSIYSTARELFRITGEKAASYLAVSARMIFGEFHDGSDEFNVTYEYHAPFLPEVQSKQRLSDAFGHDFLRGLKAGQVKWADDIAAETRAACKPEAFLHQGVRSELIAPYMEGNRIKFIIIAQHCEPRRWEEDEVMLLPILAERLYRRITLARTEEKLAFQAHLLSNVQEAVAAVDENLNIVYWNKAAEKTFGWTAEEAIGAPAGELSHIDISSALQLNKSKNTCVENACFNEVTCFHKDGRAVVAEVHTKVLCNSDGGVHGAIFSLRDITQRKHAEVALQDSESRAIDLAMKLDEKNKFITDFFINVSHEFKTPLTILMLGLELLENKIKNRPGGGADVLRNISVMKQNSYRLNRLVSNLLDITKLDAGFMEPKWETSDIISLLGNLTLSTETYARQKKLTVRYSANTAEKSICTDSFILERIMLNLLSNAIKHTAPGGHISVGCRVDEEKVTISVKDNGEGIPEGKKHIIFDRFSQVDTSLARASEGSGIGLALTKSFVELLGGRIWFESTVGVGSEFFVVLPALHKECGKREENHGRMQLDKRVQMEFSDIGLNLNEL